MHNSQEVSGTVPAGYAVIHNDIDTRLASSSGGVFSLVAETVIKDGGIVFGAAMSKDCRTVIHIGVDSLSGLVDLRGSKYIESSIGDTYLKVRDALRDGRKVLFTGTPCQIAALQNILGKEYKNLLCMDFICHGVPSAMVWGKYIDFGEEQVGSPVAKVSFRHKKYGWKTFAVLLEFENGVKYIRKLYEDLYMRAFLSNCCLRPSCYDCRFRRLNRVSDITVGDYWGIHKQYPGMDDDKGTSLVMVHTQKGRDMLDAVKNSAKMLSVDIEKALESNKSMTGSPPVPKAREAFMRDLDKVDFDILVRKYVKKPKNLKNTIKWILRKVKMETFVRKLLKI